MAIGLDDEISLIKNRSSYISHSLKIISKDDNYSIKAFPDYFYIGFPDVVIWAVYEGRLKVREIYAPYDESELFVEGYLRGDIVEKIINLYLKTTGLELECRIVDQNQVK